MELTTGADFLPPPGSERDKPQRVKFSGTLTFSVICGSDATRRSKPDLAAIEALGTDGLTVVFPRTKYDGLHIAFDFGEEGALNFLELQFAIEPGFTIQCQGVVESYAPIFGKPKVAAAVRFRDMSDDVSQQIATFLARRRAMPAPRRATAR